MDEIVQRDLRRKVQMIIMTYTSAHGRYPSIKVLRSSTGLTKKELFIILAWLNRNEYIEWDIKKPEEIRLLHTRIKEQREGRLRTEIKNKEIYNYNIWDV